MCHANGRPVAAAIVSEAPTLRGEAAPIFWSSDACTEDPETGAEGLGGVCENWYWQYLLPDHLRGKFHITELEALASVGNTLHFGSKYTENTKVCKEADATSTVTLQLTGASKSERMVRIQQFHESLEDFHKLHTTSVPRHLFGEINFLADRVSRNKMQEFHTACEQMPKGDTTKEG
jgi:hypothetical protein